MQLITKWRLGLMITLAAMLASSCSLNPNVRKQKYFQSGEHYFERGDYRSAATDFRNAITIDANYGDAHLQLAKTYLNLQQPDRAYEEYADVVKLRPDDYKTRIEFATLLVMGRRSFLAEEQIKTLLQQRPNDPAVHSLDSSLLAEEGNIPGAIGEMQETIALAPERWEGYLGLGLLQLKNGQSDAAEANFKKVIELDPQSMQARVLLGTFYESRNGFDQAEQEFRDAMAVDAKSMEPREALAKLLLAEGKNAAAESVLEQSARDLPNDPQSLLALSNFYFVTGDLNRAVAEYDLLYEKHPNDIQIKKKYIQLLVQARHYNDARRLDDEILKTAPNDSDALLFRSQMQISLGDPGDAIQTLQSVIKSAPDNSEAHYALGIAFEKLGDRRRAEAEWQTTLQLNPDSLEAERSIADAAMEQGDMRTLQSAATELIRLDPKNPEGYALQALSYINLKQYNDAELDIRKAIEIAPQSAFGYVQLGNLRLQQMQYEEATRAYEDALNRNASSIDALRGLVSVYIAEKHADKAIAAVDAQIAKLPANSSFYDLLGAVLFHSEKDLVGAEKALEKSTTLDQHNSDAWIQLCEVRAAMGRIDQAIATDEQALQANPGQSNLYVLLGNFYQAISDWKNAETAYQSALAINSQDPVASNDLAGAMLHTGGNLDVALSLVQTARAGLPTSPAVFDTMGWIYYEKGAYPLALNCLQEALSLQERKKMPDNPDIHYHLGMTYEKMKQPALARQHFDQVLKIDPAYPNAGQIKQELAGMKS